MKTAKRTNYINQDIPRRMSFNNNYVNVFLKIIALVIG